MEFYVTTIAEFLFCDYTYTLLYPYYSYRLVTSLFVVCLVARGKEPVLPWRWLSPQLSCFLMNPQLDWMPPQLYQSSDYSTSETTLIPLFTLQATLFLTVWAKKDGSLSCQFINHATQYSDCLITWPYCLEERLCITVKVKEHYHISQVY